MSPTPIGQLDGTEHPGPITRPSRFAGLFRRLMRRADRRAGRCMLVSGTLKPGGVLSLGPWRITYVGGQLTLTHEGLHTRMVVAPCDPDRAAYRAWGRADCMLVSGTLKPGGVLSLGPWRITYVGGQLTLTHEGLHTRMVVAPCDPDRAAYRAWGRADCLPVLEQQTAGDLPREYFRVEPPVLVGNAEAWPDQAAELRAAAQRSKRIDTAGD